MQMKCLYYDGRVDDAAAVAKAASKATSTPDCRVITRDASAWLQQPGPVESFDAVDVPEGTEFDALAAAHDKAEVTRSKVDTDTDTDKPAPAKKAGKKE